MRTTFMTLVLVVLASISSYGQDIATARIFETNRPDWAKILVNYDDGTKEIIPLKSTDGLKKYEDYLQVYQDNQVEIAKLIKKMEDGGLELVSTSLDQQLGFQAYMVFRRKEK